MNASDPRVRRTRKLIQDAFGALMTEKGFHSITVQDIAERATVNRATFYAHFADKYALLEQSVGDWFREALSKRVSAAEPFTLSNLYLLTVTVIDAFAEFRSHCKPMDRELDPLVESKVQQELSAFILDWLRQLPPSEAQQQASRETAATVLSWAIFGAGVQWSSGTTKLSAAEMASEVVALISGGLSRTLNVPTHLRSEVDRAVVREVVPHR